MIFHDSFNRNPEVESGVATLLDAAGIPACRSAGLPALRR